MDVFAVVISTSVVVLAVAFLALVALNKAVDGSDR